MNGEFLNLKSVQNRFLNLFRSSASSFDNAVQRDLDNVMSAAKLLQISEFRFFSIAYEQWYGSEIQERSLEYIFAEYMFDDRVPHWVRHFSRKILSCNAHGTLDPLDYNINIQKPSPELMYSGIGYIALISFVVFTFCFLISGYTPFN